MILPRYATVCSGIEAVSLAWAPLGFSPVFFSEIESFPNRVLKARWGATPNLGNLLTIDGTAYRGKVDVLWASFPCQDFSEAGKRKGVDGAHGFLTLAGIKLVDEIDPSVFCFENVKGLLTDEYNAFGQFLGALAGEFGPLVPPGNRWTDAGYVLGPKRAIAWRVLDAQHFGLPQSRPRVFLVACPRDGADPRRVLFERREEGDTTGQCARGGADVVDGADRGAVAKAYRVAIRGRKINGFEGQQLEQGNQIANCLRTAGGGGSIGLVLCKHPRLGWDIRKLLPDEYEALMGMPAGYTDIAGASATERYDAVGNSLAVPVVQWIGRRIQHALEAAYPA